MPSFDIVSKIDLQEVDNAVNQASKEISTRYDFKNSKSKIEFDKEVIRLTSDNDEKMKSVIDVLQGKIFKRGIAPKSLDYGKVEGAAGGTVKCEIKLIQGIATDKAKEIVRWIKDSKFKATAAIQDEQVRVTSKSRDELQTIMAGLRAKDFEIPLQFINFRD